VSANVQAVIARQAGKIVAEGLPIGPRMHPCVCGAGKHAHSGPARIGKCADTGCTRYRADRVWATVYDAVDADAMSLGDSLRAFDTRERDKHYRQNPRGAGEWSIGASDTSTCPRKIQYRNAPPEGFEPAPEDNREARMGTIIHNEVTRQMKAIYGWRLFDYKVRIAGLDRDSALDMYDPITGVVTDFKTAGDWRWEQLAEDGPEWTTWEQVLLYALALIEAGYTVTRVRLVYIKRCNGHDETFEKGFDLPAAEAARDRLLGYATALDLGQELPKTGTGPTTDALCRRCFARFDCWNMDRAAELERSPENVTILGEQPDEEEIVWAIRQRHVAAKVRLAAEKEEDITKALVDGIPTGRFGPNGEWESYSQPRAGTPNYKASYEQVVSYLDLPDEARPTSAHVEPVRNRGSVVHKVGPVRKAVLERERKARAALDKAEKVGDPSIIAEAEQVLAAIRSGIA
jgi:hypothetical protein